MKQNKMGLHGINLSKIVIAANLEKTFAKRDRDCRWRSIGRRVHLLPGNLMTQQFIENFLFNSLFYVIFIVVHKPAFSPGWIKTRVGFCQKTRDLCSCCGGPSALG